jgi:uncharacterized protein (TIGR02246 family)
MKRLAMITMVFLLGCRLAVADQPGQEAGELAAIRAAVDSYVAAYNRGDAQAVAEHWNETGEWLNPDGERFQGRKAIEQAMRDFFAQNKGVKVEVLSPTVRLVTADVAIEEGTARELLPGQPPSESSYIAVHVKREGKWKLDTVRETELPGESAVNENLQQLQWMVGDWIDASPESTNEVSVTWTKNKAFLSSSFRVSVPGEDDLEGTQVIGWDPAEGVIRSWMFDCDGGFGQGVWTGKDDRWIVKFRQVLADGRRASATNIYRYIDANTYTWQSIGREVDGKFAPNIEEIQVIRKGTAQEAPASKQ